MLDFCRTEAAAAAGQENRLFVYGARAASSDERRAHLIVNSEQNTDIETDRERGGVFTEGYAHDHVTIPRGKKA